jgi:hypothetical protein
MESTCYLRRSNRISASLFSFNFNALSDRDCLSNFRFCKRDITRLLVAFAWPVNVTCTRRSRYAVSPLLGICVGLRRLCTPSRWRDLEELFGKLSSQLSEIFWEVLETLLEARGSLVTGALQREFMVSGMNE